MATEKCIVVGAGGHCRVVLSLLKEPGNVSFSPVGILDLNGPGGDERILDVPVVGNVKDLNAHFTEGMNIAFLAIGDNYEREKYYELALSAGFKVPNLISANAYVASSVSLGGGNVISPFAHIGPSVVVGDNNIINTHANIEHEGVVGNHCHLAPSSAVSGRSSIGDRVFLGLGAKVIDNIKIASDTIIGAGGVVVENIDQAGETYVGLPARKLIK